MQARTILIMAALAVTLFQTEAIGQTREEVRVPAEFPPASFTGRQYVDSRGCAFIRAGVAGQTTWVPRVSRDRKVICGFKPSLTTAQVETAKKKPRVIAQTGQPEIITVPRVSQSSSTAAQPAPNASAVSLPKQTGAAKAVGQVERSSREPVARCPGASQVSGQYFVTTRKGIELRCGPQKAAPYTIVSDGSRAGTSAGAVSTNSGPSTFQTAVIASRQAAPQPIDPFAGIKVPKGYKPVWQDDRLNPRRAVLTEAGTAQMETIWSNTVPRVLLNKSTGRPVTVADTTVTSAVGTTAPTVSTRSRAPRKAQAPASHRFVQAGVFSTKSKAVKARRLIHSKGLPTLMGTLKRNGQNYLVVLAGPFSSQENLNRAYSSVRSLYGTASLRK